MIRQGVENSSSMAHHGLWYRLTNYLPIYTLHSSGCIRVPVYPILISTCLYIVIYLPLLLCVWSISSLLFQMSLVFRKPADNSENIASVVNDVNNGEECAQWGPLTTVKKSGYYDQGFHHCAWKRLIGISILTTLVKSSFPLPHSSPLVIQVYELGSTLEQVSRQLPSKWKGMCWEPWKASVRRWTVLKMFLVPGVGWGSRSGHFM